MQSTSIAPDDSNGAATGLFALRMANHVADFLSYLTPARFHSPAASSARHAGASHSSLRWTDDTVQISRDGVPVQLDIVAAHARVNAYGQLVATDDELSLLNARVAILAHQMSPELRRGTEITALFSVDRAQSASTLAQLLALQIGGGARALRAFHVQDDEYGVNGFYRLDGRPVENAFLRYPVNYTRITSLYSLRRAHPILKSRRPHLGVDLAAPRGTPVVAVADGEVVAATWIGNYGRTVAVRHDDEYTTGYSHLERIASGIVFGTRVRKGQVVGYVGQSGLATGPHVHFSMIRNGSFVDPLTARVPALPVLTSKTLRSFQATATELVQALVTIEARRAEPTRIASRSSQH